MTALLIEHVLAGEDNLYDAGDYARIAESFGIGDVRREGHLVWDHVQRQCESGLPVTVGSAEIACSKPIPPRPPYLRIAAVD